MDWFKRMNDAIAYLEAHLDERIDYEQAARVACCSAYHFQRMFSYITNVPLSEYIRRRRMTLAALDLHNGSKVIDVALKYGYESPEAFARVFQTYHDLTPTAARASGVQLKAYPCIFFQMTMKGDVRMDYRMEKKAAFQVYGIERVFDTEDEQNLKEIPDFWLEKMNNGEFDRLRCSTGLPQEEMNGRIHGACSYRKTGGTTFPYMLCCFATPKSDTAGYVVADVPACEWAIFSTAPHTEAETSQAVQKLNSRIYSEWLPGANLDRLEGADFEVYLSTDHDLCYEEIWIPIAKA